ncbi:hypothetical protein L6452_44579 [Arctium lappa]|uniref:Uncharacterized protein n=1 Tax=Arctium lappa TaxID=4217 RepID=A0ACB8XGH7_ARCLA|nr:hypothetical protein L6452_44579 [Arctium lappa]
MMNINGNLGFYRKRFFFCVANLFCLIFPFALLFRVKDRFDDANREDEVYGRFGVELKWRFRNLVFLYSTTDSLGPFPVPAFCTKVLSSTKSETL